MEKQRFDKYFENWLYGDDGYYVNYKQIGKKGDFYTSVSTSSFFGGTIGKKIVDTISLGDLPKNTTILEIGAHHGYLVADVIQFIYTLKPELLNTLTFAIIERFEPLKEQQKKYLQESFGDAISFRHYTSFDEINLEDAFIFANEIFDAFPCNLVHTKNNQLHLAYVKNNKIEFEKCDEKNNKEILDYCKKYKIEKGEVPTEYNSFVKSLCNAIKKFEFISFDYGDKNPRNDFSIRVYEKHKTYPIFEEGLNLEKLFSKTDITYDVFFQYLIDCFKNENVKEINFKTQMVALVDFGIIDLLEILKEKVDMNTYLRESQKVKTLIEATGMGDRFKMIHIKK